MPKSRYYVVWKGRKTGVFSTWAECAAQVSGFEGAEYKAFDTLSAAEAAFKAAYADYKGKRAPELDERTLRAFGRPIPDSYCVDASSIGNPGWMEYHCVHTTTRKELFSQGPFENGTNNVGEFLAIVHALSEFKKRGWDYPIYSDSAIAILWVKIKKCKTRLLRDDRNAPIFDLIARAEEWLKENTYTNRLLKWETQAWGEIPADYGRK